MSHKELLYFLKEAWLNIFPGQHRELLCHSNTVCLFCFLHFVATAETQLDLLGFKNNGNLILYV